MNLGHLDFDIVSDLDFRISVFASLAPLQLSRILYKSALFLQNEPNFRTSQMNVNKVLTMNYEKKDTWWTGRKRTQTNPNKPNFQKAQINVTSIMTKDYENICPCGVRQNKPNPPDTQNERNRLSDKELPKSAGPQTSAKQSQSNPKQTQFAKKAQNERNRLFYKELRKSATPGNKSNLETANDVQEQPKR